MYTLLTMDTLTHPNGTLDPEETRLLIGNKAMSLVYLARAGFNVPAAAFLPTTLLTHFKRDKQFVENINHLKSVNIDKIDSYCQIIHSLIQKQPFPDELLMSIQNFLARFQNCGFAVRSSGTLEDTSESSFAGLYTSVLNRHSPDEVLSAVRECLASLYNARVIAYCRERGLPIDKLAMGVVIQQMIPAERSGVSFSVNPVEGHDTQIVTEACWGLGESLVSGHITPDRYIYDWKIEEEISRLIARQDVCLLAANEPPYIMETKVKSPGKEVLSPAQVGAVSQLTLDIQRLYGHPVDIEWAMLQDTVYPVQARPITRIQNSAQETEWTTADFKDGGVSSQVCTPFMWSLYDFIWERTMPDYLEKTRLIPTRGDIQWGQMFYGRPYWNLGAVKAGLKRLPGFCERDFDESLGIKVIYEGKGHVTGHNLKSIFVGLNVLYKLQRSFKKQLKFCKNHLTTQTQRLQTLDKLDPAGLSDQMLFDYYKHLIVNDYWTSESSYFNLIYDNSNFSTLFKDFFSRINQDNPQLNYLELIGGLVDLSHLKQNQSLWETAHALRQDQASLAFWKNTGTQEILSRWLQGEAIPGSDNVARHLEAFKHNSTRELDITVPHYAEDPSPVFESLQQILRSQANASPEQLARQQQQRYLQARQVFLRATPLWQRKKAPKMVDTLRNFLWWREELRDLSTRMYYQIRRYTLVLAERLEANGLLENKDDIFFIPVTDILAALNKHMKGSQIRDIVKKNRWYYQSFRNYQPPDEIGQRYGVSSPVVHTSDTVLKGIGCSPGVIEGTARVVTDIFAADYLQDGDILITRFTDPGWTPKFALLSGVVTETGGMLSHAAVISREYGIPAVLAVNNVTGTVQDGSRIRIDGNLGTIEMLQ